ncbi:hypothetical protein HMPREF1580_00876, partial [Gardnerella vaginalis JCP8070]
AGFAMATPAFAADAANEPTVQEQNLALAQAQLATAKETLKTKQEALKKDNDDIAAYKKLYPNLNEAGLKAQATTDAAGADQTKKTAAEAYTNATGNLERDTKAVTDAQAAVDAAQKLVDANTPAAPKASANVAVAKLKDTVKPLTEAQTKLDEAFGKYDSAYVAYKQAQQDKADAKKALEDYTRNHENEALPTYHAEVASLTKALKVAEEAEKKAKNAYSDAKADFEKAKKAFTDAWDKYNGAYKAALAAKADVSDFKTPESLNHDFNSEYQPGEGFVPGVGASHAGKPGAAKPGKPGQAAGQAGANGAAAG